MVLKWKLNWRTLYVVELDSRKYDTIWRDETGIVEKYVLLLRIVDLG